MTRPKTISDEELLEVARRVFREQGHTASTREIARQAGISEGILYQRFGSKKDLFFASMAPGEPDIEGVLGPQPPVEEARVFLRNVLTRMARYFAEIIPLALQVMTHPSEHHAGVERAQPGLEKLRQSLAARLAWFEGEGVVRRSTAERCAQLLVSLAHDWAIGHIGLHRRGGQGTQALEEMAEIVWRGVRREP